jgi:hypothetical protein
MKRMRSVSELRKKRRDTAETTQGEPQQNGLDDLPIEVAVMIELRAQTPEQSKSSPCDEPVESLAARLEAIRERIWRLQALFAVSLSHDCAIEANQYLNTFQALANRLKEKDASAFDDLVRGHESLLLSPSITVKQTIPIAMQRLHELRWEVNRSASQRPASRESASVPDGLGWML